ncbi:MAG: hypothetical protein H6746_19955 [Deltaproteobacteria bacterium]|nr:hypothetical protein [Deltaproteobacteria bacterium]
MHQSVHRSGELVSAAGKPIVRDATDTAHTLSPAAAAIWFAADGTRDAAALQGELATVEPGASLERVFALLDELGEAGLIKGRLAPPTEGVDRRGLFRRFAFGAAAAVVAAPVLARSGKAQAAASEVCLDDMSFHVIEAKSKKEWKHVAKDLADEMKQKQKLDDEAADLKVKSEEVEKKGKDDTQIQAKIKKEQAAKQDSYHQESALKAKKQQPSGDSARETRIKAVSAQRRFGVGTSAIFIDVPGGETFEGLVELGDVVMDGDGKSGCTLSFTIGEGSALSVEGGNLQLLDRSLVKLQGSDINIAMQWGTEGEFAAVGVVLDRRLETVGFDAATGKPSSQRAIVRLGVRDETYAVGADGGGF